MKRTFFVKALWDEEFKIWYSETDIIGLFINSESLEQFEEVVFDVAGELVLENHWRHENLASIELQNTVPIILWEKPQLSKQAA